jgi:uncharacterized repeat protein (TIGR01451 family)
VETSSGDPSFVEFGGLITYKICFNNLGTLDAQNAVISDYIPAGTSLVSVNPPPGATVSYFPSQADATRFDVSLGTLHAPANSVCYFRDTNVVPAMVPPLHIESVTNGIRVTWQAYSPSNSPASPSLLKQTQRWIRSITACRVGPSRPSRSAATRRRWC